MGKERLKTPLILFNATYNSRNLGDWYIIKVLLDELLKFGQVVCKDPRMTQYGLHASFGGRFSKMLKARLLGRAIYMVGTPGHFFSIPPSTFQNAVARCKELFLYAVYRLFFSVRLCRFGVSIGPLTSQDAFFERLCSNFYYFYSVRDSRSMEYVRNIGVENALYFCDMSLLGMDAGQEIAVPRSALTISFRKFILGSDQQSYDSAALLKVIRETAEFLSPEKIFCLAQAEDDRCFTRTLAESLNRKDVEIREAVLEMKSAEYCYQRSEIVISNRLHVLLLAMGMGALPLAVIDAKRHDKVAGFFKDAGLSELIFDFADEKDIRTKLADIRKRKDQFLREIQVFIKAERIKARKTLAEIFR